MSLTSIFLAHSPIEWRQDVAAAHMETVLARLVVAGREAWPDLTLSDAEFAAFLGRSLPASAIVPELHANDLWLVCAYCRGVPAAVKALETRYMPRARSLLRRMGITPGMIDDILQEIRQKLVEGNGPEHGKASYSGRGDLGGWLCIVAVRAATRRREQNEKAVHLECSEALVLPTPDEDPEMALIQREYRDELLAAFREALASLSARDRNLLRFYFLDGMSIDKLGGLYGVHRATASRWVNEVRTTLCTRTRDYLCRRISLSQAGFQRVLGLIESQIRVNLEQLD